MAETLEHYNTRSAIYRSAKSKVNDRPLFWWVSPTRTIIIFGVDLAALLLSALCGYMLWAVHVLHQSPAVYSNVVRLLLFVPVAYAAAGLYPGIGLGPIETIRRLSLSTIVSALGFAALTFLLKLPNTYSRVTFAFACAAALVFVPVARFATTHLLCRLHWWQMPVILAGNRKWARKIAATLQLAPSLGYRPIGIIPNDEHSSSATEIDGIPLMTDRNVVTSLGRTGKCELLVQDAFDRSSLLSWLQERFCRVVVVRELGADLPIQGACVTVLGDLLGIQFTNSLLLWHSRAVKRTLDLIVGTVFLGLSVPLIGLGALMVWWVDGRPVFFCQQRRGLNERVIRIWKLRTMYRDAEARLDDYLTRYPTLSKQWVERCKLDDDPRLLPYVGKFLRRYSLDELPQLFSVVGGQMSLVGPRPFPDYHLRQLPKQARELRHRVLPGLTGMWQVAARGVGNFEVQSRHDQYYIRNWSVWLDLYILARTVGVVLSGRGAK